MKIIICAADHRLRVNFFSVFFLFALSVTNDNVDSVLHFDEIIDLTVNETFILTVAHSIRVQFQHI